MIQGGIYRSSNTASRRNGESCRWRSGCYWTCRSTRWLRTWVERKEVSNESFIIYSWSLVAAVKALCMKEKPCFYEPGLTCSSDSFVIHVLLHGIDIPLSVTVTLLSQWYHCTALHTLSHCYHNDITARHCILCHIVITMISLHGTAYSVTLLLLHNKPTSLNNWNYKMFCYSLFLFSSNVSESLC